MCYLENNAELKMYVHPSNNKVPEHVRENEKIRRSLTYTIPYLNNPGKIQPEY